MMDSVTKDIVERGCMLDEAKKIINGERRSSYGEPEDCFKLIADYWNVYLGAKLNPADVGRMMALLKIARMAGQGYKRDNYVDAAGYLGLVDDMEAARDRQATSAISAMVTSSMGEE